MGEGSWRVAEGRAALARAGVRWGYCLNVHPSESLAELRDSLDRWVVPVRQRASPGAPLGVELRLGAAGVRELAQPGRARELAEELAARGLVAFAANAYPLSRFTAGRVKERVYRPDWTEPERAELTLLLASALAEIAPGPEVALSTLAGAFRPGRPEPDAEVERQVAVRLVETARELARLEGRTGKRVRLCLEPEPCTTLETTAETVRFFERLFAGPDAELARRHLAVNLDLCHQAVVFEDPVASLSALAAAGVPVGKVHVSAALRVASPGPADLERLADFDEPRWLHQTFARAGGRTLAWLDLAGFLAAPGTPEEVRVHFHAPLDAVPAGRVGTTADLAAEAVRWLVAGPECPPLVVETYTWEVLRERDPRGMGEPDLAEGIARELHWLLALAAPGPR